MHTATKYFLKAKEKEQKYIDKQQARSMKSLNKEEMMKARMTTTLLAQAIELMNDCVDDMVEMKLIHHKSGFADLRKEYLRLQEFFIKSQMNTEEEELERIKHQRSFEVLMRNIARMKPKQLSFLIEYSENLKNKN